MQSRSNQPSLQIPGLALPGRQVVGVDRSPTLLRAAATISSRASVVMADAAALPFADSSVSLVVSCMSLHDLDDFATAITEVGRILCKDGSLCAAIVHPFVTAQDDDTLHTDAFRVSRPYLEPRRYDDRVERNGLGMTFVSVHQPLSAYTAALAGSSLAITHLSEHGTGSVPWPVVLRAQRFRYLCEHPIRRREEPTSALNYASACA